MTFKNPFSFAEDYNIIVGETSPQPFLSSAERERREAGDVEYVRKKLFAALNIPMAKHIEELTK